jgi:hypothetical protein
MAHTHLQVDVVDVLGEQAVIVDLVAGHEGHLGQRRRPVHTRPDGAIVRDRHRAVLRPRRAPHRVGQRRRDRPGREEVAVMLATCFKAA